MPRIRKKTSKRGTTAHRARIKHKVREGKKKSRKEAKRDLTWKSKNRKDPGIPNNFPYKDQILAEIAEERRQSTEAKARRKEEKRKLRAQQNVALEAGGKDGGDDDSRDQDSDDAEGEEGDFDGVAMLAEPMKRPSKSTRGIPAANSISSSASASTTEASRAPLLLNPDLPHLAAVLDKADVVIEVLDARDPLAHRSHALEARVASKEGQKLLLVLNKIDACPREPTAAWATHLRSEHPTLFFRVGSSFLPPPVTYDPKKGKGKSKEPSDDAWGLDAVSKLLGQWAQEKTDGGPLHVAVVGLSNSGKSAFINSLARKSTLDVYAPSSCTNNPTTTPHALEVTVELNGASIVFIDTPGLAWQPSEEASPEERLRRRARDVLLRNKGRIDRLKDPIPAVSCIVSRAETEDLMVFYGLPAFTKGDVDAFLMGVARSQGLIKKGGDLDLAAAARLVLRDWSSGKLSRYAVPPAVSGPGTAADAVSPTLATIYAGDAALLERLLPRKELRRSRDVVRLSSERIDDRALALDAPWFDADGGDGESDSDVEDESEAEAIGSGADGGEEVMDDVGLVGGAEFDGLDGSVSDEDDDNEDEDEDEDEVSRNPRSSLAQKRKRPPPPSAPSLKPQLAHTRPRKKVAFAASVKATTNSTRSPSSSKEHTLSRPSATRPSASKKKSNAKPPGTTPPQPQPRARKSAANAPTTTARKRKAAGGGENDAYDFSKFF
ncbi:hypothetical protein DFH94DRAFT_718062 [Russula ochroleuca]|uniref:CP-type G domain-containing protein n=1 Tax=Russula ochroleuca TaxID=152965 RepID=A0A9P5TCZ9_9AGAM|nr:hypothetical protein DFH94DRAFT_718062 [Russula ochroleuca]